MSAGMYESNIQSLPLVSRGKVRDMYAVDDDKLLIVCTDRLSAFDVILKDPIPGKGEVLTRLTEFWMKRLGDILPTHSTGIHPEDVVRRDELDQVRGRAVVVKRLKPILIEAVARGYLSGSGWKDYQASGSTSGVKLPAGLQQGSKLPEVIFTPAAKARAGTHDDNVDFAYVLQEVGVDIAERIRAVTLRLYREASAYAAGRGIIIADTKFEFGLDNEGMLRLMDEVLTPDSSRFWPAESYTVGISPPSFDKQFVRDWLEAQRWDKTPPAPRLPPGIVQKTAAKYREALDRLTA
jgi:phosphoribosylaminoimidazole-succinocarboxamide synthase